MSLKGSRVKIESSRKAGVIISYAYSIVQILVQLLYVPILLKGIGQAEYGLYQFVGSIMAYLTVINTVLASSVTKFYSKAYLQDDSELMENTLAIAKRLFWIISFVAVVVIVFVGIIVVYSYSNSFSTAQLFEMSLMFVVLAADMVVVMNNIISIAVITAHEKFVFLRLSQLITAILQPLLVVVFMHFWPSALLVTCMTFLANLLCALIQRLFVSSILKAKATFHGMDWKLAKEMLLFSSAVILVAFSDQVFWKSGQLILGYFYGADLIAVFAIGAQIYSVYMVLGTSISTVFLPKVTDIVLHSVDSVADLSRLFIKVGRISFYVAFLVLSGFAIFGQDFITLWAGHEFADAYWVAMIVMVPFTVDIIQNLGLIIMQVKDVYQFRGYMNAAIAVINVFISIFLCRLSGVTGSAISTAVSIAIGNGLIMNWYYAKKLDMDILQFWKNILSILVPLLITSFGFNAIWTYFDWHGWSALVTGGLIYSLLYMVVSIIFCFDAYEREFARRFVGPIIRNI